MYLIDIVIESLENYRSLGTVFPLQKSNLFKYLPPSNHSLLVSNPIPTFMPSNNHRIDLTPGVLVPYRRLSSSLNSRKQVFKPVLQKQDPNRLEPTVDQPFRMLLLQNPIENNYHINLLNLFERIIKSLMMLINFA